MIGGKHRPALRIRIVFGEDEMMGPGKAELLARIAATGSIAAAGRQMGMSYKRAWLLVETMNRCFRAPVVETSRGGQARGGAVLTPSGEQVLAAYRRMEVLTTEAIAHELEGLRALLRELPAREE